VPSIKFSDMYIMVLLRDIQCLPVARIINFVYFIQVDELMVFLMLCLTVEFFVVLIQ